MEGGREDHSGCSRAIIPTLFFISLNHDDTGSMCLRVSHVPLGDSQSDDQCRFLKSIGSGNFMEPTALLDKSLRQGQWAAFRSTYGMPPNNALIRRLPLARLSVCANALYYRESAACSRLPCPWLIDRSPLPSLLRLIFLDDAAATSRRRTACKAASLPARSLA